MSLGLCHHEGTFNNLHFRAKIKLVHIFHFPFIQSCYGFPGCGLVSDNLMIFAMGAQELRLEINPWQLLHERSKLFPSSIQEPANENWICILLNSFTRINSPHFPASMKYGQIENFPVAPSNTACLENPPVFLTKEFNFSFSLTFASCFPLPNIVRGAFNEISKQALTPPNSQCSVRKLFQGSCIA